MIENTVLFNKDQTDLIAYPPENRRETYRIPESVVKICENAFCWARYLKEVTIPDSVTDIGGCAFLGCDCEIVIDDGNKHYSSAFGSLYNKDLPFS